MDKLFALLRLVRPLNDLLVFASVLLGAVMATGPTISWSVLLAGLSAALISAGGYGLNDFCDVEIDRINRAERPIPSGKVSPKEALYLSVALMLLGISLALWIGPSALVVALFAALGLLLYDFRLKHIPFWGNLLVSALCALTFMYGGLAARDIRASLIPGMFALLFHFGREIVKDVEDIQGDAAFKSRTIPVDFGPEFSFRMATMVYLILMGLTFLPFFAGIYNGYYLIIAVVGVDLPLIYVLLSMWKDRSRSNLRRLNGMLKGGMAAGLVAILAGKGW